MRAVLQLLLWDSTHMHMKLPVAYVVFMLLAAQASLKRSSEFSHASARCSWQPLGTHG